MLTWDFYRIIQNADVKLQILSCCSSCINCSPSSDLSDCAPAFVAPQGRSEETARRLWEVSCELLGVEWD